MCINFLPVWLAHKLRCKITTKIAHMQVFEQKKMENVLPFVGKQGNYHGLEIPLYYRFLRENIAQRCAEKT